MNNTAETPVMKWTEGGERASWLRHRRTPPKRPVSIDPTRIDASVTMYDSGPGLDIDPARIDSSATMYDP